MSDNFSGRIQDAFDKGINLYLPAINYFTQQRKENEYERKITSDYVK